MRSYEAAGAVRVVEPDILAHKNTRDGYRVEDKRGEKERMQRLNSTVPTWPAFAPCLDLHLLSFCNFQRP